MAAVDYQFLTIFGCVGLYVGVSDSELTQFYYIEFQMVIMQHAWIFKLVQTSISISISIYSASCNLHH